MYLPKAKLNEMGKQLAMYCSIGCILKITIQFKMLARANMSLDYEFICNAFKAER